MDSKTVVHLTVGTCFGGVETHICTLIKLLNESNFSFKVVCHTTLRDEFEYRLKEFDTEIIAVDLSTTISLRDIFTLGKIFKSLSTDILHCHLYTATRIGAMAAKFAGVKKVVETIHIEEIWRYGFKKWIYCSLDAVNGWLFVDRYIAVSKAVSGYYQRNKGVSPSKISLIHNTTTHKGADILSRDFSFTIGFLGRLSDQKGIDVLIKAVSLIHKRDIDCTLLIGGEGPLRSELEKLVDSYNLSDSIQFLGNVSDKDEFFNRIDIFALASRNEGFPLVLLEAGIYKKPVVATKVSGNPEIIIDEETGLLVESENPDELAAALTKYLEPGKRETLSTNLKQFVEFSFSPTMYVKKMRKFYSSLIDSSEFSR